MTPVRGLLPEEIGGMWETICPLIEKGLARSERVITAESIGVDLLRGSKQLLFSPDPLCILITELLTYPNGRKVCDVFLTAGDLPADWRAVLDGLEGWAREKACSSIEMVTTRKGWSRRLPDWEPVWTRYRKELSHE